MTFLHLSDLHLGKRVHEVSMLDDQHYILQEILAIVDRERPQGLLIAGDVYDKPVPPAAAVELFDWFLSALSRRQVPVFLISGNHDSAERLAFGAHLMAHGGVYIAKVYDGEIAPITLIDEHGELDLFLLPFLKPVQVARLFEEETVDSYTDAMRVAISRMPIDPKRRNLLVTHQFVTGALTCDSEELSVGGTDQVDVTVFDPFDYVALGHLHGAQHVGRETVRYCGTPLKYSFSEVNHTKSVTLVTCGAKGDIAVRTVPLTPKRDMFTVKGAYHELTALSFYDNTPYRDAYMRITLTDEDDIPDAVGKLSVIYKNLLCLDYDNRRTRADQLPLDADGTPDKAPIELLDELFKRQHDRPMNDRQRELAARLIDRLWEEEDT